MKRWGMALCCLLLAAVQVRADEGMWLLPYLQKLNIKDMKAKGYFNVLYFLFRNIYPNSLLFHF